MRLDALIAVAERTREPKILLIGPTTSRKGIEMLDVHGHTRNELRGLAVAATVLSRCRHFLTYGVGEVRTCHDVLLLLLLDRNLVATSGEKEPGMRLTDEQTAIFGHELLESDSRVRRQLTSILALKKNR